MKELLAKWLRPHLLGGVEVEIARLRRELDAQRAALSDLESLRPQIAAALSVEPRPASEETAAALQPILEAMLRQRERARSRRRWRSAAVVVAITAASTALAWRWQLATKDFSAPPIRAAHHVEPIAAARIPEPPPAPRAVVLVEESDGFGLGQATRSDAELASIVRGRLVACPELAGAELRFSVEDGWIWLRGVASENGRHAAERSLIDLGDGVLVVNQIETATSAVVAER